MKNICKVESFNLSDNTNFNKCKTIKGCYRDLCSYNEAERFTYYLVAIDPKVKYIIVKGINNKYMARRGNMFISKYGNFPKSMNKENTICKILYTEL